MTTKDKKEDLLDTAEMLDETCNKILRALLEERPLRYSEIPKYIAKMYGINLTNRVLDKHLKHMQDKNLIDRTQTGFQRVEYSLSDHFKKAIHVPKEQLRAFFDLRKDKRLPPELRSIKFNEKAEYNNMTKEEIDEETDKALHDVLSLNLWELKLSIENSLQLKDKESDEAFWAFFANPLYRIHEKGEAKKCQYNEEYKKALFEKIDLLIDQLRSDKQLRKRNTNILGKNG